jgi:hypothetical protein
MEISNKKVTKNMLKHIFNEYLLDVYYTYYAAQIEVSNLLDEDKYISGNVITVNYDGINLHFYIYIRNNTWIVDLIYQDNNETVVNYVNNTDLNLLVRCLKSKLENDISLKKEVNRRRKKLLECKLYEQRFECEL